MAPRYIEEATFEDSMHKIEKLCKENNLLCKLVTGDPVKLVIWPDMSMDGQISMLDNPAGHNGHGSVLSIIFADAGETLKTSGEFVMDIQLLKKFLSNAEKMHRMYMWSFYRQTLNARRLAAADLHAAQDAAQPVLNSAT